MASPYAALYVGTDDGFRALSSALHTHERGAPSGEWHTYTCPGRTFTLIHVHLRAMPPYWHSTLNFIPFSIGLDVDMVRRMFTFMFRIGTRVDETTRMMECVGSVAHLSTLLGARIEARDVFSPDFDPVQHLFLPAALKVFIDNLDREWQRRRSTGIDTAPRARSAADETCIVCSDRSICMAAIPCGHRVCCHACSVAMTGRPCSVCRAPVHGYMRTFTPEST